MSAYRIYCLDEEGLVVRARVIEAATDAAAMIIAADMMKRGIAQLWSGTRLVGTIKDGAYWQGNTGEQA